MPQLIFQWPAKASYAADDFIPSTSNETAWHMLERWPDQGSGTALLFGPAASGKTHLAQCWAARVGATLLDAGKLGTATSEQIWEDARHAVLEDIDSVRDETALFHLLRHTESHGLTLLLSARSDAKHLPFTLPDLRSRLLALPVAELQPPDEALLEAFLMKYFSDRQLRVEADVISYIAKRVERSFASAADIAGKIERASTQEKREITVPFVRSFIQ